MLKWQYEQLSNAQKRAYSDRVMEQITELIRKKRLDDLEHLTAKAKATLASMR